MGPHYILLSCYTYCLPHFSIFLPSPPPSSLHLLYLSPSIISTSSCYTLTLSLISPPPSLLISSHSTLSHLHFPLHLPHLSSTFPSYTLSPSPSYLLHLPFLHPLTLSLISPPPSLLTPSHPLPHISSTFPSYTLSPSPSYLHLPFLHPLTLSLISPPPSLLTPSHPLHHLSSTFPSYTLSPSPSYLLHLPFLHPLTLYLISPPPSLLTPSYPLPHLSSTFPSYTRSLSHYFLFYFPTPSHTLPNLSSTFPPCIHLASVLSYSYAFALEESSQRRTAEALARKALAMNPTIAWSYHALCESRLLRPKGSVGVYKWLKCSPAKCAFEIPVTNVLISFAVV